MQNPRLALRYAKSLLDLATEKTLVEAVLTDMRHLLAICKASREFSVMLNSPVIRGDKKIAVINAVSKGAWNVLSTSFIQLVVNKGRESVLSEIAASYINLYNERNNIKLIKVTTAIPMTDAMKHTIVQQAARIVPTSSVSIETVVDSDLIGGYVLETGDKLMDRSVRKKLNDLKKRVLDYSYVNQI